MIRYSGTESTLDGLITQLTDSREHGAPDTEQNEPITGFTISENEIIFYNDEP